MVIHRAGATSTLEGALLNTYQAIRQARSTRLRLRGIDYHLQCWGPETGRPTLLLHGWMDVGLTWQFLVDALTSERRLLAPDWRGFGHSGHAPGGYWFPDYLADLDALLDAIAHDGPVDIVGHSMGGNIAGLYAGLRPERVRRLVLLEGFGMARRVPAEAVDRYRQWLDEQASPPNHKGVRSLEALARRLRQRHPHLPEDRALFVAEAWTRPLPDGSRCLLGDPRHKGANPVLYRLDEAEACWRKIRAPSLWMIGEASGVVGMLGGEDELRRRQALVGDVQAVRIPEAGHMLHHDQPARVAEALAGFLD